MLALVVGYVYLDWRARMRARSMLLAQANLMEAVLNHSLGQLQAGLPLIILDAIVSPPRDAEGQPLVGPEGPLPALIDELTGNIDASTRKSLVDYSEVMIQAVREAFPLLSGGGSGPVNVEGMGDLGSIVQTYVSAKGTALKPWEQAAAQAIQSGTVQGWLAQDGQQAGAAPVAGAPTPGVGTSNTTYGARAK